VSIQIIEKINCDRRNSNNVYSDDVIDAAWQAGIGVHALIWVNSCNWFSPFIASLWFQFGWDDPNIWKRRRDTLLGTLHSNRRAKYVTRVVQFGSEPLYDYALDPRELASQVRQTKANLSSLEIPVTISEMAYGYQVVCSISIINHIWMIPLIQRQGEGSMDVMSAIDFIDAHTLPFFSTEASTGKPK
jgi:hypothetical protein